MNVFLGVDIGSVSSNFVLMNNQFEVIKKIYLRTLGNPVQAIRSGFAQLMDHGEDFIIKGVGTTGSGRYLGATLLGADIIKNEITAHAVAAAYTYPDVRTIIEIGGQDSKIILIRNGVVHDFAMNTVCAAGTGSFLDQQAARLNIAIENFGGRAAKSRQSIRIAGRCGVFAESDMIHKQQMGFPMEDIMMGLCEALVRNYLNNVAKGKKIEDPVVFQGGVAANIGLKLAFEKVLAREIHIPRDYDAMGAIGAAILACEKVQSSRGNSQYRGADFIIEGEFRSSSHECKGCPNLCEVVSIKRDQEVLAYWGDRCKKWENSLNQAGKADLQVV